MNFTVIFGGGGVGSYSCTCTCKLFTFTFTCDLRAVVSEEFPGGFIPVLGGFQVVVKDLFGYW